MIKFSMYDMQESGMCLDAGSTINPMIVNPPHITKLVQTRPNLSKLLQTHLNLPKLVQNLPENSIDGEQ